jgi:hypothetical protein
MASERLVGAAGRAKIGMMELDAPVHVEVYMGRGVNVDIALPGRLIGSSHSLEPRRWDVPLRQDN